jgi:hypothetical protein
MQVLSYNLKTSVVDLMERLTLEQYRRMVDKVIKFEKLNGEMPKYTVVDGCKISKKNYIDMIETVNKFLLEMGRSPGIVEIGSQSGTDYSGCNEFLIR